MFETLDELIGFWPSEAEFARDIGLKPSHVAVFKVRRNMPSTYWPAVIEAADRRKLEADTTAARRKFASVTAETLLKMQVSMAAQSA